MELVVENEKSREQERWFCQKRSDLARFYESMLEILDTSIDSTPQTAILRDPGGKENEPMTKSELVEAVAQKRDISKNQAELAVNCIFDTMFTALERGDGIELRGFGTFTVRKYNAYKGRNPKSGKVVDVPEKRLPFFRVGKAFKALLKG